MSEPASAEVPAGPVGLVLAGGCARGAYEFGALSVLLPALEQEGRRPTILTGTSVGALNASYLAAKAGVSAEEAVSEGIRLWKALAWKDVIGHVLSLGTALRALAYGGEVVGLPRARVWSLLDSTPLAGTIDNDVDFTVLHENVEKGLLDAAAVVTTSAVTHNTVVFHDGGGDPGYDYQRLIGYVGTPLLAEHVLASTAMPAIFPAVDVQTPPEAGGWYYDGGTRLNAPTKPALSFGARRLVVIGLTSLAGQPEVLAGSERPDLFAGISLLLRGLMGDQLAQGVHTLARINEEVLVSRGGQWMLVPYIAIAPERPATIEQLAFDIFLERYKSLPGGLKRSVDIELVGRLVGAGAGQANATLLSLLLFDPEFIDALIDLGAADARRWIDQSGEEGIWRLRTLPEEPGLAADAGPEAAVAAATEAE
jgi:NTE family protein